MKEFLVNHLIEMFMMLVWPLIMFAGGYRLGRESMSKEDDETTP